MPIRPRSGRRLSRTPKKIVVQFFSAWLLETENLASFRIHAGHHVLDGAVFAGSIHALKNQQHRIAIVSREQILPLTEFPDVFGEDFFIIFFDL